MPATALSQDRVESCAAPLHLSRGEPSASVRPAEFAGVEPRRMTPEKSIQEQFAEIGKKYSWDEKLLAFMTHPDGLAATSVRDFTFLTEAELPKLIEKVAELKNRLQQTSRLRQAWSGMKTAEQDKELLKRKRADDVDMDELLRQEELDDLADIFHARYHLKYPNDVMPSDATVSRVSKELSKRLLTMRDVWKVKSQTHQQRASTKRTKLAEGLDLIEKAEEAEGVEEARTVQKYLDQLFTLFLAYAIAGAKKVQLAPTVETRMSDPTMLVEVPLDVLVKVHHRATVAVRKVRPQLQLQWLESRMDGERESWIEGHRNTDKSLGQVVMSTYINREAVWTVDSVKDSPRQESSVNDSPVRRQDSQQQYQQQEHQQSPRKNKTGQALRVAKTLRDGTKLCGAYQKDACRSKSDCWEGKHFCGGVQDSERVCGGRHPARRCNNGKVKKKFG